MAVRVGAVRHAMAPIAIGSFVNDQGTGLRSPAGRFIKIFHFQVEFTARYS